MNSRDKTLAWSTRAGGHLRPLQVALAVVVLATAALAHASPEVPGAAPLGPVALVGAALHPVGSPDIARGTLVLVDGKITALGADLAVPAGAEVIDLAGLHVYPGLIDAYTDLGLVEIPAVRASVDVREPGRLNPNLRAEVGFNPDSELLPVARANGVLLALVAPRGEAVAGTSALMMLDGWTWEDMTLRAPIGMHVTWPRFVAVSGRMFTEIQADEKRAAALETLRETLSQARAYVQARLAHEKNGAPAPAFDARLSALGPLVGGELPFVVEADEIQQIESALAFASNEHLRLIILGGYDAALCAERLKQTDTPVILTGVHRLPQRADDPYDASFTLPQRLQQAGVRFCIAGGVEASQARNLAYHAATAAAYGLAPADALRAITLSPAEICGVADRVGSLAHGRDATLIVTTGDPLEIPTQVVRAFIQGRPVDLGSRHTRLWEKYQEKYRRLAP